MKIKPTISEVKDACSDDCNIMYMGQIVIQNFFSSDTRIEEFSQFTKTMDQCVQRFYERSQSYGLKYDGGSPNTVFVLFSNYKSNHSFAFSFILVFQSSHRKFGLAFTNLSYAFEQHQSSCR